MTSHELADWLSVHAAALSAETTAAMYANPFWHERYGARGRFHTAQDGVHHCSYLAEALRAGDARVMETYARWLRTVLVSRGMCSLHLDETFVSLGDAIRARLGDDRAAGALALLANARRALAYQTGEAAPLSHAHEAIVERVQRSLVERDPSIDLRWRERGPYPLRRQIAYLVSYLADGLAMARSDLFSAHTTWLARFLAVRGHAPQELARVLSALGRAVLGYEGSAPLAAGSILAAGVADVTRERPLAVGAS